MRAAPLAERLAAWAAASGVDASLLPAPAAVELLSASDPCRPPADPHHVVAWERRHGFRLPTPLRAWLLISDGFYLDGPMIHPLTAIGPMIPFASVPNLVIQPESWFELGNPGAETICIDLAYDWPGGGCPIFTSGDDLRDSPPRIIATGFDAWFLELLHSGCRESWLEPGYPSLGDPWREHRRHTPVPALPERLRPLAPRVLPLMHPGADDRAIAAELSITRCDLEAIFRHLQHAPDAD